MTNSCAWKYAYFSIHVLNILFLILLLGNFPSARAQGRDTDVPFLANANSTGPTDPLELESFLEDIFKKNMERLHIPGAVFVLVKDGEIFLKKGYGYADLENRTQVDPDKTLFRVASVSKVLTVTGIMQLYERGLIDLDEDVNRYLELFQVDNNYPEPVTFENLITHTAGFDHNRIGLAALDEDERIPLGEYLAQNLPPRVMPPGKEYSYSRHGIALAGYLIEVISGVPFPQYINDNILQPLGMSRSSFLLPQELKADISKGYRYEDGRYKTVPYYYFNTGPEASFNATADDMAKFMIAHLQNGQYQDVRILKDKTARLMQQRNFAHHPSLPGIAYGFYERMENGHRAIQHGGHIPGFVSRMLLVPDLNMGFFMSCNNDQFKLISSVTKELFDHYYQAAEVERIAKPQRLSGTLQRFDGTYLINNYSRCTLEKIFSLKQQFSITPDGKDGLRVKGKHKWIQVEPILFQNLKDGEFSAFKEDNSGNITHWFNKRFAFRKLYFYETASFHLSVLGSMILIFLSACFAQISHQKNRAYQSFDKQNAMAYRLLVAVSISNLASFAGLGLFMAIYAGVGGFTLGVPPFFILLLCLPVVSFVLTIFMIFFTFKVWKSRSWSFGLRLHYTLVALGSASYIVFLHYWNLLGFRF